MIEIVNGNTSLGEVGAFPIEPTPEYALSEGLHHSEDVLREMIQRQADGPNIALQIFHQGTCDPNPDNDGYWLQTSRAVTLEQWCGWVLHLAPKTWLSKHDLTIILSAWWVNRGLSDPSV